MPRKKTVKPIDYVKLYQELFGTENGKLVLFDLCNRFYVMGATRHPNDKEGDMEFREGQRNVALFLLKQVNYDLEKFLMKRDEYQIEVRYD